MTKKEKVFQITSQIPKIFQSTPKNANYIYNCLQIIPQILKDFYSIHPPQRSNHDKVIISVNETLTSFYYLKVRLHALHN